MARIAWSISTRRYRGIWAERTAVHALTDSECLEDVRWLDLAVVEAISDHRCERAALPDESCNMRTSIIIVNWNGKHHLEVCLPALNAQTLPPDEVIVVDNGSTDASIDYLKWHHPQARVVVLKENRGFAGGNVAGLDVASGDYIVLLNNDTKPDRAWLENLVACCDSHPDVGLVASHITDWDGATTDSAGDGCRVTGRGFQMYRHRPTTVSPPPPTSSAPVREVRYTDEGCSTPWGFSTRPSS